MEEKRLYLDTAATAPLCAQAAEAMRQMQQVFANPASQHTEGQRARAAYEDICAQTAQILGCKPGELVFTSGGTESDNLAMKGYAFANRSRGKHIVVSAVEHPAVLQSAAFLEQCGFEITYLPVDRSGSVCLQELRHAMRRDTILVAVMHVNNETGVIQPVQAIAQIAHDAGAAFFSDGVAAAGHTAIDQAVAQADLYALSAHKFGGPKGAGLLFVREGVLLEPILHGGGQQQGRRSGTPALPLYAGLSAALQCAQKRVRCDAYARRMEEIRCAFERAVLRQPHAQISGCDAPRAPGYSHVTFSGLSGEGIAALLDIKGVAASAGAACHAGDLTPSHVMLAMGMPQEQALGSVRFTFPDDLTAEDAKTLGGTVVDVVSGLYDAKLTEN